MKKCPSCHSCGMPFEKPEDHALGLEESEYCNYCTNEKGELKTYEEVLEGFTHHLLHTQGLDPATARKMAQEFLSLQPAWSKNNNKKK